MFAVFSFVGAKMQSLARVFASRVANNGGTTESLNCINPSYLLSQASFLQIPSGYKAGVAYAELPANGNGDLTWSRNSVANRTQSNGSIGSVAANVPRLSYMYGSCPALLLEPQRTNSIRNSSMVGAVAGSPGTLPTNWTSITSGLTFSVVGVGTENGLPYVDVRLNGTATGTGASLRFDANTQIVASNGQTWASSFWIKSISSTSPPLNYANTAIESTAAGGFVASNSQVLTITSTLTRNTFIRTIASATTERIINGIFFSLTNGASYDFTIRIAAPQMELGAFATTWINTTNAAATRLADTFSRNNIYTNGLITSSGGTWFVELRGNVAYTRDGTGNFWLGDSSTGSGGTVNSLTFRNNGGGSSRLAINKVIGGTLTALYTTTTDTTKIAIKWNGTTADVFANGTKVVSATSFTATNMEFLNGAASDVPKFIQAMALYPTPLSDAQCQTLTT